MSKEENEKENEIFENFESGVNNFKNNEKITSDAKEFFQEYFEKIRGNLKSLFTLLKGGKPNSDVYVKHFEWGVYDFADFAATDLGAIMDYFYEKDLKRCEKFDFVLKEMQKIRQDHCETSEISA